MGKGNEFPVPIYLRGSFCPLPSLIAHRWEWVPSASDPSGKMDISTFVFSYLSWQFDLNFTSVLDPKINFTELDPSEDTIGEFLNAIRYLMSAHDMKRLEAYADNLVDFHLVRLSFPISLVFVWMDSKIVTDFMPPYMCYRKRHSIRSYALNFINGLIKLTYMFENKKFYR